MAEIHVRRCGAARLAGHVTATAVQRCSCSINLCSVLRINLSGNWNLQNSALRSGKAHASGQGSQVANLVHASQWTAHKPYAARLVSVFFAGRGLGAYRIRIRKDGRDTRLQFSFKLSIWVSRFSRRGVLTLRATLSTAPKEAGQRYGRELVHVSSEFQ